jgi:hypothetical protein
MLHHAVMSEEDRQMLGALLDLFNSQRVVRFTSMLDLARTQRGVE